jgi:DNA polymerase-3 subunit delta
MVEEKPIVYILRGDDRESIESTLHTFYKNLGAPDMAEMNTTRLEGTSATLNDLKSAALSMPFLTERRMVILENALKLYDGKDREKERAEFLALLEALPPTTALILILPDSQKYTHGTYVWEKYPEKHWFMRWVKKAGNRTFVEDCALPTDREMMGWIQSKAQENGGSFTPLAAATLAEFVGNNTQRAAQEINKLLTYVNFTRPVDDDDVRRLTVQEKISDIFALVDAIGNRNGEKALDMLHLLLDEMSFSQVYGMIIRQFRLILQAQEIIDTGGDEGDVAKLLHQHPFVAKKISAQTRQFDLATLESIYHRLLRIDIDTKTGGMDGDIALDTLIAELAYQLT